MLTWRALLRSAERDLESTREARWIVERASGWEGGALWSHLDDMVPTRAVAFFDGMVERRRAGEPLQYVLGRWGFRRLDLYLDRRVLIPRPETEMVVQVALAELSSLGARKPTVVDLGTGSGAIGLSVAVEVPSSEVWAVDRSAGAVSVARANLAGAATFIAPRVRVLEGSWCDPLPSTLRGRVHLVVSNASYVGDREALPSQVADWEPAEALRSGPTGLEDVDRIVKEAPSWLVADGGVLVVEIAPAHAAVVLDLTRYAGFSSFEVRRDLADRDRMLVARC